MEDSYIRFERRCRTVRHKHIRMADGYVTRLNRNGVIVQTPDRKKAGPAVIRALGLAIFAALILKAVVLAALGPAAYEAKRATLLQGNGVERAGAFLMQADPLTVQVASRLAPHFD